MKVYKAEITHLLVREEVGAAWPLADSPEKVVLYLEEAKAWPSPHQEAFVVMCLNRKNRCIAVHTVTIGTATASLVHPREVFRPAIMEAASAIIVAHNHPSGDPAPSQADIKATRQLREAAKVLQFEFLDHVIVGEKEHDPFGKGWYSFAEAGLL